MEEKDGYPLDMTFPVGETSIYYFAPFVWSGGGELVSDDGLTADGYFNSEQTARPWSISGLWLKMAICREAPIDHLFESGRAAFKFDGAWEVNTVYNSYPDLDLGGRTLCGQRRLGRRKVYAHRLLGICGFI